MLRTKVGGTPVEISQHETAQKVMFDTGFSDIALSYLVYNPLIQKLLYTGTCMGTDQGDLYCICDEDRMGDYPNITFYTTNAVFNVTAREYLISPIQFDVR